MYRTNEFRASGGLRIDPRAIEAAALRTFPSHRLETAGETVEGPKAVSAGSGLDPEEFGSERLRERVLAIRLHGSSIHGVGRKPVE